MRLRLKVQKHLVVAWKDDDNGEWIFTLCRQGFGELIGQKLRPGEEWLVEVNGKALQLLKPKEKNDG